MSYEQLLRDLAAVKRFAPSLVVLDEAQRIKNWATKSSAHVMSLEPEWRLVLTGTPLENRLEELATLLDWIDDAALAPKWRLEPWHSAWASQGSAERVGVRHLDTLRVRLAPRVLRRVRREVLRQLPARGDERVPLEMTEPQREEHDARIPAIARLVQTARPGRDEPVDGESQRARVEQRPRAVALLDRAPPRPCRSRSARPASRSRDSAPVAR